MENLVVPILETERLRLRGFRTADFDDYAAMCADPEVSRYLARLDREQAWRHLAFLIGHWCLLGLGMWAVERRGTGELVGRIGFADPEGWPGCELAWTLARRFWGCGYATEAARAALDHAFGVLGKDRIISLILPENLASIRVAERLGQCLQGRALVLNKEHLVYGIDREAYELSRRTSASMDIVPAAPPRLRSFPWVEDRPGAKKRGTE